MKIQCIDNNPSEKKCRNAIEFLSISVLPEDDPVGLKHVELHFIGFKCCFGGFNGTLTF
jgi:hypothetical protein